MTDSTKNCMVGHDLASLLLVVEPLNNTTATRTGNTTRQQLGKSKSESSKSDRPKTSKMNENWRKSMQGCAIMIPEVAYCFGLVPVTQFYFCCCVSLFWRQSREYKNRINRDLEVCLRLVISVMEGRPKRTRTRRQPESSAPSTGTAKSHHSLGIVLVELLIFSCCK